MESTHTCRTTALHSDGRVDSAVDYGLGHEQHEIYGAVPCGVQGLVAMHAHVGNTCSSRTPQLPSRPGVPLMVMFRP